MDPPYSAAKRRRLVSGSSSPARTLSTSAHPHEKEEQRETRRTSTRWAGQDRAGVEEDVSGGTQEPSQQCTRDNTPDNAHGSSTTTMWPQRPRFFPPYTSLVLIGIRGSGLSSLAVIAAKVLRFRILDVKSCFASDHGKQRNEYAQEHGWKACRNALVSTMKRLMDENPSGAILVCGPEVLDSTGQKLLWDFASSHPVVMISRDLSDIQHHLGLSGKTGADHVLRKSAQVCRQVSNMEFYNLPERIVSHTPVSTVLAPMRSTSTATSRAGLLQNVKRDFVQFLNTAMPIPGNEPSQLLHPPSPEFREFSNAMRLSLSDCVGDLSDFGTLGCASDAVELVVTLRSLKHENKFDFDVLNRAFQLVRRVFSVPVILHVETTEEELGEDIDFYSKLVRHGARLLPEFITINLFISPGYFAALTSQLSCSKIIGHRDLHADESSSWETARAEFDRAVSLGCDVVRLVGHANSPLDDRKCSELQAIIASESATPLIAVNVGMPAQASAISNQVLTPVSLGDITQEDDNIAAIPSQRLMQARFQSYMYQPLQFYIIGASVSYSLSPTLHNAGFEYTGMQHVYSAKETNNIETMKALVNESYGGASISLPFKTEVLSFLDSVSEACEAIQAVNTILPIRTPSRYKSRHLGSPLAKAHKHRAGPVVKLHGENTDWVALHACIARHLSPANEPTATSSALVIGAGGMARASVYALHKSGVSNVVVWNRTFDKANSLADHFNKLFSRTNSDDQNAAKLADTARPNTNTTVLPSLDSPWPADLAQPSIIICTIPSHKVSDAPPPNLTIPQQWFASRTGGLVIELSYKTRWTPLLEQVVAKKDQGWNFVEPLEVLIEQGCAQFELFTGCPAPRGYITEQVVQAYQLHST